MTLAEALALIVLAAEAHGVPEPLLRAVCRLESGLDPAAEGFCGVRRRSGGWVAPEQQPDAAAHALARWRGLCRGSWPGALTFFHTGRTCTPAPCPPGARHRHRTTYAGDVLRFVPPGALPALLRLGRWGPGERPGRGLGGDP